MTVLAGLTTLLTSCEDEEDGNTVIDIDCNTYRIVTIGNQVWLAENLKTTTYNDGKPITLEEDDTTWSNLTTGAYCWYDNDKATYGNTYGPLYNWYAVETGNLCPDGWHVPTNAEWTALEDYLTNNGYDGTEGTALKAISNWINSNDNGTDNYGFTALPGGARNGNDGDFGNVECSGYWWSSTEFSSSNVWYRTLIYSCSSILRDSSASKKYSFSVRCIRD